MLHSSINIFIDLLNGRYVGVKSITFHFIQICMQVELGLFIPMEVEHVINGECNSCENTYSENIVCVGSTGSYVQINSTAHRLNFIVVTMLVIYQVPYAYSTKV